MSEEATAETIHRTCPLCEAHCGITVQVDRDADRVTSLKGDPDDALSAGYVCPKVIGLRGLEEDPDRLVKPLLRRDDGFVEIEWEEAFQIASSRLSEIRDAHGANAIATYLGNPNAHDYAAGLTLPLFQRALGTRWRFSATSVDQLPKMVSSCLMFGAPFAIPVPDIDHTDFFLVLGANPLASNGSLMTAPDMRGRLRRLRERGILSCCRRSAGGRNRRCRWTLVNRMCCRCHRRWRVRVDSRVTRMRGGGGLHHQRPGNDQSLLRESRWYQRTLQSILRHRR